jgi:serine phosphatase RsbU (regulator of sigma subunit)/PAS domain-containing protein
VPDRAPAPSPGDDLVRAAGWARSTDAPVVCLDTDFRFVFVNDAAERVLDERREDMLGRTQWQVHPLTVGTDVERAYRHAMTAREPVDFEQYYAPHDRWYRMAVRPAPGGIDVEFADTTAERRTLPAVPVGEDAVQELLDLLTETSTALSTTLDVDEGVRRLARLVVPRLADWVIVSTYDAPSGALRDETVVHGDPARQPLVERYAEARVAALSPGAPVLRAAASGRPVTLGEGRAEDLDAFVAALVRPSEARRRLLALRPGSIAAVPLLAGGRTVGLLSLFRDVDRPGFTDQEMRVAADVGVRAGTALENGRLYTEQRQLAEGLQRSLLTEPPALADSEVVVRYVPAASAAQVGGDWYDAFVQPGGTLMVVIGDVAGHDTVAAAAMGQLRGLLRGIAVYTDAGPAEVLAGLDRAVDVLSVGTIATAAVARFEQDDAERARGVTRLRWSNAGHPPPLAFDAEGRVTALAGWRSDLLLGVDPVRARTETVATLPPDSTVFFYTDGLIERRDSDLDEGLERLREALAEFAHLPLGLLCDAVVERLVDGRPEDDVALVAVRLHRQDRG